jgi:pimeloyl-ACP methyl ester carboxylesterase
VAGARRQHFVYNGRSLAYLDSLVVAQPPQVAVAAHDRTGAAQDRTPAAQDCSPANTVVLLHAFPLNADMWQAQLDAAPARWRFIAPDLQGFGHSPLDVPQVGPGDHRIAAQDLGLAAASLDTDAADVIALLDHLGTPDAVIVGLSMGGYLALALCRIAPSRVSGLVLANTKAEPDTAEGRRGREQMMARVAQVGVAGLADEMLPRLLGETSRRERPDVVARVRDIAAANGVDGVRRAIAAMMHRPDSTGLLADLACPALVMASEEDQITPPDQARAMHRILRAARLVVMAGAGHLSNLERPDAFNDALHRFLHPLRSGG